VAFAIACLGMDGCRRGRGHALLGSPFSPPAWRLSGQPSPRPSLCTVVEAVVHWCFVCWRGHVCLTYRQSWWSVEVPECRARCSVRSWRCRAAAPGLFSCFLIVDGFMITFRISLFLGIPALEPPSPRPSWRVVTVALRNTDESEKSARRRYGRRLVRPRPTTTPWPVPWLAMAMAELRHAVGIDRRRTRAQVVQPPCTVGVVGRRKTR
jgi:hypothetical protein